MDIVQDQLVPSIKAEVPYRMVLEVAEGTMAAVVADLVLIM